MSIIYSTGPVENAANNSSVSVLVKMLNNSPDENLSATIYLYSLNGAKEQVAQETLSILPWSSDFCVFEVQNINEYEVQIESDREEDVLFSVWGLDADANLVAAQRLVHTELAVIAASNQVQLKSNIRASNSNSKSRRKRTR